MLSEIRRKLRFLLRVATGHSLSDCYAKGLLPDTHCRVSQNKTTTKVVRVLRRNIGQKSHDDIWRVFSSWSHEPSRELEKPLTLPLFHFPPFTYNRFFLLEYSLYCADVVLLASYKGVEEYTRKNMYAL